MRSTIFRWAAIIMAIISFGIAAYFAGKIYYTEQEYAEGDAVYEEIIEQAVVTKPEVPGEIPDPDGEAEIQETQENEAESIVPEIDFALLKTVNEDVVGWLYLPDTVISYPVVQGDDNSYYLKHLVDGTYSANGCLFMDHKNQRNLTDDNTLIYGHHMDSGKMFASLVKYKDQEFYEAHPVIYFLTEDEVYQVELFAGYTTTADAGAYKISISTREEKIEWLKEMFHSSDFFADVTVSALDHIVTFSTCAYDFHNARYVLHYKDSPLVQQAILDCKRILSEREFAFAKELYEEGFVYEDYVLSNRVAYELREDGIELMDFSSEQSFIIYEAAEKGMDVRSLANPEFSVAQMELMKELLEDGNDVTRFVSNGKKLDLSEMVLSEKQISDIRYFLKVDEIPKELYSEEQWKVMLRGIRERLDVTQIANPNLAVVEMKDILKELRREKREAQAAELETTLGLQDNGKYRYYSTQRPISPGTFPNGENKPVSIENFDERQVVENGQVQAWGYLEYDKPLSQKELKDYELKAVSASVTRVNTHEKQTEKKKSVLADLHKKQAQISGVKTPKKEQVKKNDKEMQV